MIALNKVVAREAGARGRRRAVTDIYHRLKVATLHSGLLKTYEHNSEGEDGETETLPPEHVRVAYTVPQALREIREIESGWWDTNATREWGNTQAFASVKVGDLLIVENAPVGLLIFMEKRLTELRGVCAGIPTLDPSEAWSVEDQVRGIWRSEPRQRNRTGKRIRAVILAPATEKFPAQVKDFPADVPVGVYTEIKYSGAVHADARSKLLWRIDTLLDAVRAAREEANQTEVQEHQIASAMFDYLLAD